MTPNLHIFNKHLAHVILVAYKHIENVISALDILEGVMFFIYYSPESFCLNDFIVLVSKFVGNMVERKGQILLIIFIS